MNNSVSNSAAPQFTVYPKRKSTHQKEADIYLRISYQFQPLEKSLGIRIPFDQWEVQQHQILNSPIHNDLLQAKVIEYKQKIMGAYYMLTQHGGEFTLREIMDNAFYKGGGRLYSQFGVSEGQLIKMEKLLKSGQSTANIGKHRTCLKHLRNFMLANYRVRDIGFNRVNRNFIDDFELVLCAQQSLSC